MLVYQFNNEPLRIMLACLSAGMRPTDAFITSTLQKHLFRETKLADAAVTNPDALKWLPITKRYCLAGKDEEDKDNDDEAGQVGSGEEGRPMLPSKLNPMLVSIYGQVCVAAKSYQSAICSYPIPFLSFIAVVDDGIAQFTYYTHMITAPKIQ